jgi:hypothetical protein
MDYGPVLDLEITPPTTQSTATPTPPCANPTGGTSPAPNPNTATLSLAITLPGIGKGAGDNPSPKNNTRTIRMAFTSSTTNPIYTTATLNYNPSSGNFEGSVDIGNVPPTAYTAIGKLDSSLSKVLSNALVITTATKQYQILPQIMFLGDIDDDDSLTIQDYNNFVSCFRGLASCDGAAKSTSDLNDNGTIDTDDLNILQRSFKQNH